MACLVSACILTWQRQHALFFFYNHLISKPQREDVSHEHLGEILFFLKVQLLVVWHYKTRLWWDTVKLTGWVKYGCSTWGIFVITMTLNSIIVVVVSFCPAQFTHGFQSLAHFITEHFTILSVCRGIIGKEDRTGQRGFTSFISGWMCVLNVWLCAFPFCSFTQRPKAPLPQLFWSPNKNKGWNQPKWSCLKVSSHKMASRSLL